MANYVKSCPMCRKVFENGRKDAVFCSPKCKMKSWRTLKDFTLVAELVPEKEVKEKYYKAQSDACVFYIQWFTRDKERLADVYVSNQCADSILKRFKKTKQQVFYR